MYALDKHSFNISNSNQWNFWHAKVAISIRYIDIDTLFKNPYRPPQGFVKTRKTKKP